MNDIQVDILVIGAGAAGLAAAISAHDAGASVAILEKMERPGGNSALSTGSVPGAGTRFQRAAGITDSAARFAADLRAIAPESDDPALVERLAAASAPTVEWLVDKVGARLKLITAYKHVGHSVPRLHAPASRRGQDLVDDLLGAVEQRGISLAVGNPAVELVTRGGGVSGAIISGGSHKEEVTAHKVILAVNGFAANRDLVRRFCPEIAGATYFGAHGSTGEAVLWGEKLGAALANIGAYQGYAAVADPHGSLLTWTSIEKGGFLVGKDGRRFGDESVGYSAYARTVLAQKEAAYAVFDHRIFEICALEEEFMELVRYGGVKSADTPAELAKFHGLDGGALTKEIEAYNAAARGTAADRFGRRDFGTGALLAPLYIVRVIPGLFHTQGGLRVDKNARVLRPNGTAIANLFAAGGAAAGISGRTGAAGYASGNGLLSALALGRLAGLAAVRELKGGHGSN